MVEKKKDYIGICKKIDSKLEETKKKLKNRVEELQWGYDIVKDEKIITEKLNNDEEWKTLVTDSKNLHNAFNNNNCKMHLKKK